MKTPAEEAIEMKQKKRIMTKIVSQERPVDKIRRKKSQNQRKTKT